MIENPRMIEVQVGINGVKALISLLSWKTEEIL
jgi:hypothetical protein